MSHDYCHWQKSVLWPLPPDSTNFVPPGNRTNAKIILNSQFMTLGFSKSPFLALFLQNLLIQFDNFWLFLPCREIFAAFMKNVIFTFYRKKSLFVSVYSNFPVLVSTHFLKYLNVPDLVVCISSENCIIVGNRTTYRTRAIIGRSWLEAALKYKPYIRPKVTVHKWSLEMG